jgi:mRNA interferase MazF
VSPDEINQLLKTVIVAPMTTVERPYPMRLSLVFQGRRGQIAVDQLRAVAHERLLRKLGSVPARTGEAVSAILLQMFSRQ